MTRLRSKIAKYTPKSVVPFAKRQIRLLDRLKGMPTSSQRPGVVLMLHVGRCGSTVLANLLGQDPAIHWDGKLHRKARQLYGTQTQSMDIASWTKRQFAISGRRFYGFEFKILDDQYPAIFNTTTEAFLESCKEIGVTHYILLVRRNTLRHVVSHYASKNRGNWHAADAGAVRKREFTLDINAITTGSAPGRPLLDYLREVDAAHETVRRAVGDAPFLEIEYETDIDEKGAEFSYQETCRFLGTPPADVAIKNVKLNPFPIRNVLLNFDEVEAALEGTEFAWMTES